MEEEKRSFGRVDTDNRIICKIKEMDKDTAPTEVVAKDISPGGVSFDSDKEIAEGIILELEMKFPFSVAADNTGAVLGKVVRCLKNPKTGKYEVGVAYVRREDLPR